MEKTSFVTVPCEEIRKSIETEYNNSGDLISIKVNNISNIGHEQPVEMYTIEKGKLSVHYDTRIGRYLTSTEKMGACLFTAEGAKKFLSKVGDTNDYVIKEYKQRFPS